MFSAPQNNSMDLLLIIVGVMFVVPVRVFNIFYLEVCVFLKNYL